MKERFAIPMVHIDWNLPADDWNRALAQCPDATFFHTDAWLQAIARSFGTRIERARLTLPDGSFALLPLSVRSLAKGLVPLASVGETGAYGGLVSPASLAPGQQSAAFAAVRRRYPDLWVSGNPFATQTGGLVVPGGQLSQESTHVLALKPLAELRQGFSRGCKSRGNKARKAGLTLRVSQHPTDAARFYALYEDTVVRWGDKLTWARPRAFFEHMVAEGGGHVKLFLAYQGDRLVSGLLFASHGGIAHYVAGATRADALPSCPSNFLMEEAMAHYAEAGYTRFDFGPSNGLEGVIQFKESFGAEPLPFVAQRTSTAASRLYFSLRRPYERLQAWSTQVRELRPVSPQPTPAGT
jgi:CelD/BcsL family acetyltransferase involved in cellulose biosynthesis